MRETPNGTSDYPSRAAQGGGGSFRKGEPMGVVVGEDVWWVLFFCGWCFFLAGISSCWCFSPASLCGVLVGFLFLASASSCSRSSCYHHSLHLTPLLSPSGFCVAGVVLPAPRCAGDFAARYSGMQNFVARLPRPAPKPPANRGTLANLPQHKTIENTAFCAIPTLQDPLISGI